MFHGVGIGAEIQHVTNGVHARTWTAPRTQELFDEALGDSWANGDQEAWDRVEVLGDDQIAETRRISALRLADLVKASTGHKLDPDALIIGFARRFAPYKRANLLFQQMERLEALLRDDERPLHFVFSGKAHPADHPGKALVADVAAFSESDRSLDRFTFIPDYDMSIAATMVQGCDVWLNNPIRPREASGTSGEKVALNGGLNCSILDGWWAEMFDGRNGWGINSSPEPEAEVRDLEESSNVLTVIESITEEYHHGRAIFHGRIRHAWRTLGPKVTASRMVRDYETLIYGPARERVRG
jgi:starch phosphorylase